MIKYSEKKAEYTDRWGKSQKVTAKIQEFGGIQEFVNYLDNAPINKHFKEKGRLSSQSDDKDFTGTENFQEALGVMRSGWTTYAKKLSKRIPVSTNSAPTTKMRPTYSVVGGQASVPRYLQGIPTNMIDRKRVVQKQKIITINKDISYSSMTSTEQIQEEGVKALQIIQGLENRGYRVKLNMCWASTNGNETLAMRLTVKKPEERMALNKIAFPIAHPSMLRRLGFKWMESFPEMSNRGFINGYGRPATELLKKVLDKKEVFLPSFIPDVDKFIEELGY